MSKSNQRSNGPEKNSDLIGTAEAARLLDVGPTTIQRWIDSGDIPAHRTPGGHRRIQKKDFLTFLKANGFPIPNELYLPASRILVIDDEPVVLKAISKNIHKHHPKVEVDTASNGIEALLRIGETKPDLIILDIVMPDMDGIEVIRRIKAEPSLRGIKIIAMSGALSAEERHAIVRYVHAFYEKGDDMDTLMYLIPGLLPSFEISAEDQNISST